MISLMGKSISVGTVLLSLWVLGFLAFTAYVFAIRGPEAARVEPELEREWAEIRPMPKAIASDFSAGSTPRMASVSAYYEVNVDYPAIRGYYDAELDRNGWRLCKEEKVIAGGQDLGGMEAYYSKAEFQAYLQYAGERASYGWTYTFGLTWGYSAKCE